MERLSKRQRVVLGMAVQEFIVNAQPVGSQHIVETYQGHIDVESTVGKGSTFTVTLPTLPQVGILKPAGG